jgi:hypothetical protein
MGTTSSLCPSNMYATMQQPASTKLILRMHRLQRSILALGATCLLTTWALIRQDVKVQAQEYIQNRITE